MRSDHRLLGGLGAALATTLAMALAPAEASAFCRTTTVPVPASFDPTIDQNGCFDDGLPLFHAAQCVPYRLRAVESPRIPNAVISSSLARAFAAWTAPSTFCAPGITGIELAPTTATLIADYTTGERGQNVVGVVDGPWPHGGGDDTLALATLTFNANTGEIYDADLELRSDVAWSLGAMPPADGFDFDAVITHETGHLLGLAHSNTSDAVMSASYAPGSIAQRTLSPDDERGICAIYPDRQTRSVGAPIDKPGTATLIASSPCDLAPGAEAGAATCGEPLVTNGCSVSASAPASSRAPWLAAAGLACALALRSRTRQRRSGST